MRRYALGSVVMAWVVSFGTALPEDWPQFGGPGRDFRSNETGLLDAWPVEGPRELWSRPLGEGYSGISVAGDTLYTMYGGPGEEIVAALRAGTGETLWEHRYAVSIPGSMNLEQGSGPHATPLVAGGTVLTAGVAGKLLALDRGTGRKLWERELIRDHGGTAVVRGYSSSPLAYRDRVIVPVGGPGRAVMAFRMTDGEVLWSRQDFENTNASPVLARIGSREQVIVFMANVLAGLDPESGDLLFQHPTPQRFHDSISMPVIGEDGLLFCSSYADGGSRVLRIHPAVEELWHHAEMRLYYTNAVRVGDHVYGSSGDLGPTFFTAVHVPTGEIAWRSRELPRSSFLLAEGKLLLRDEEGGLSLAVASPEGVEVRSRVEIFEAGPPAPPSLSNGRLFARDRKRIAAFDLAGRSEGGGR